jgi:cytochrome oxidase Cu insertion factor (SCO1/SenC/PrrC family)
MMTRLSPRTLLLVIFAIFLLPLLLAWFMYSGVIEFEPESTRNHGTLVHPPITMPWGRVSTPDDETGNAGELLLGHWTVVYPLPKACRDACIAHITSLRQVHRASGRNQDRVRIALLEQGVMNADLSRQLASIYAHFVLLSDPETSMASSLAAAGTGLEPGATYLIDPLGNIMMFYESGADPNDLNKDLKRLLTWSKMDKQQ